MVIVQMVSMEMAIAIVFKNYSGKNCDELCITDDCLATCICDSQAQIQLSYFLQANTTTSLSLNFTSIQLFVYKNFSLTNSSLLFDSSSIIVEGCIQLENITMTLDLKNINTTKIVLFDSVTGCLSVENYSIKIINEPSCLNVSTQKTDSSLFVVLTTNTNCNKNEKSNTFDYWIIIVIVAVILGLLIIFISVSLSVPESLI